jgi:hypothetical protein
MAATKEEAQQWRKAIPRYAILHKLHAEDINRQFGGIPRQILLSWDDYDKYIHLTDVYAYDLVLTLLGGPGVMLGQPPFMLDEDAEWHLAIGRKSCVATGKLQPDGNYLVSLRLMTAAEKRQNAHGRVA